MEQKLPSAAKSLEETMKHFTMNESMVQNKRENIHGQCIKIIDRVYLLCPLAKYKEHSVNDITFPATIRPNYC